MVMRPSAMRASGETALPHCASTWMTARDPEPDWELIGDIGVDAGMAGFFRDKPDYTDEEWYQFCSRFDHRKCYTGLDYGVASESGYGDGSYDVYANADRSAFMIEFLYDEDEE